MKKTINLLGWICVSFTILALIFTILTNYHFIRYIKYFNGYYTLQWCLFFTMLIWGIKTFEIKWDLKNMLYSIIFILMAAGTMFFMYMKVY